MIVLLPIALVIGLLFLLTQTAGADTVISKPPLPTDREPVTSANPTRVPPADLYQLAINAGFNETDAQTAAAIALAESSGNPNAYNPETAAGAPVGLGSVGLWQIYQYKHPEFNGWNLRDPQQNAKAAYSVFKGAKSSFRPWSTFTGGQYSAHLATVANAINV